MQKHSHIYLDYAATTPVDAGVLRIMMLYFSDCFGNPSSTHWDGQRASAAVFKARHAIAQALHADYKEIIFTGSATEANNLALQGTARGFLKNNKTDPPYRIIISAIEHESALKPCTMLEKESGMEVVRIPVDHAGIINLEKFKAALNERTILVSVQYANSEIGVIQPIAEIGKIIKKFNSGIAEVRGASDAPKIIFHTDAVQAFQFLPCMVDELGVDLLTLSAHKIYGPKGIGVLYARKVGNAASKISNPESRMPHILSPIITGGDQEFGMRAGTENVPTIVGFGAAVVLAEKMRVMEAKRVGALRDYFWKELKKIVPDAEINGSLETRLPHMVNVYFPGRPSQDLCIELDLMGMAVSPGTACSSRTAQPSYVIDALGLFHDRSSSSLRFSLGRPIIKTDIDAALSILKKRFIPSSYKSYARGIKKR